jgi:CheY-like chemotaxis protein
MCYKKPGWFSGSGLDGTEELEQREEHKKSVHRDEGDQCKLRAIISTGYSLDSDAEILTKGGVVGFLQKPFDVAMQAIQRCREGAAYAASSYSARD